LLFFILAFRSLPSQLACRRRTEDDMPHSLPTCLEFLTSSCWRTLGKVHPAWPWSRSGVQTAKSECTPSLLLF